MLGPNESVFELELPATRGILVSQIRGCCGHYDSIRTVPACLGAHTEHVCHEMPIASGVANSCTETVPKIPRACILTTVGCVRSYTLLIYGILFILCNEDNRFTTTLGPVMAIALNRGRLSKESRVNYHHHHHHCNVCKSSILCW